MRAVCVYCGSSTGSDPRYVDTARELGRLLARRGVTLVYGGASVGTMGAIADAALVAGGRVHGVITRQLVDVEIAHAGLTTLDVMGSMHERKARLAELADGFIGLPGGLGTLDELFEMLTWSRSACIANRSACSTTRATGTTCSHSSTTPSARVS